MIQLKNSKILRWSARTLASIWLVILFVKSIPQLSGYEYPSPTRLGGSLLFVLAGVLLQAISWSIPLSREEKELRFALTLDYLSAQISKYLPGGFFHLLHQYDGLKQRGWSSHHAKVLPLYHLTQTALLSPLVFSLLFFVYQDSPPYVKLVSIGVICCVIALVTYTPIIDFTTEFLRSRNIMQNVQDLVKQVPKPGMRILGLMAFSMHLFAFGILLNCETWSMFMTLIGGYAFAIFIGLIIVILPSGMGVREGTAIYLLSDHWGQGEILLTIIMVRIMQMILELILGTYANITLIRRRNLVG